MSVNEQLSIDLSGIDISGSGRIIMDNSGSFSTTGNISCNDISINNADISQIKLTSIDTSVNSEKILMINSSGNIDICSNFIGGVGPQGATGPQGPAGSTTFTGLTDTPSTFTASKYLAVNSAGNAIELVDAPSGGGGGAGNWASGTDDKIYYNKANVGIGTNNPRERLQVNGNIMTKAIKFRYLEGSNTQTGSSNIVLGDIDDVDTTTNAPTDGQALVWDNTNSKWMPGDVAIGGGSGSSNTIFVANNKGIRVTHDKGNIINFTFPTNDGQRGRHELIGNLTDDKGIHQSVRENVFHSRYDDGKSAFQQVTGNYTGFDNIQETTTDVNGTTYAGLWFQWEFVSKVKINSMRMMGYSKPSYTLHQNSVPQKSKIFGSNDGTTWYPLVDEFDTVNSNDYYNANEAIWKNYTINATKEYKYIRYAVNKVCGNWGLNNDSWLVLSELEMFGDVVVEQAGVTNVIKGQTLETIAGVCDGRTVEGISGTYTLPAVTQPQECADGSPWAELTGSKISYKPPSGTKQVIYKLHVHISGTEFSNYSNSFSFIASMRIKLDNNIITNFEYHEGGTNNVDAVVVLTAIFDIGSEDNVSEAKLLSWNANKEIKIEVTGYPYAPRTTMYHSAQIRNENGSYTYGHNESLETIQVIKPRMEIKAIGEKTTVNSFVPHDGMTIQTQHKDYKKKVMKDNAYWDPIDDDLDTGFVVKIEPTSANSKVMISTTVHIGMIMSNSQDARWWGAKLYRKIGSGGWLEVEDANGDDTVTTLGGSNSDNVGTPVWFSNTSGIENSSTEDILIANVNASFLDSPNTSDTIYYTIRWASKIGNLSVNSILYLNRAHSQGDAYRPAPLSSITASEIWSSGSPYIPPTDGVISVYNSKIGIDNTTPSYDLDVSGNINFTGTLYQDGVEFSGGGSSVWSSSNNLASYYNLKVGNVGYGTDYPGIANTNHATTTGYGMIFKANGTTFINAATGQELIFRIGNADKMRIKSDGNVGIGTTNPLVPLHITTTQSYTFPGDYPGATSTHSVYSSLVPQGGNPYGYWNNSLNYLNGAFTGNSQNYNRNDISIRAKGSIWTEATLIFNSDERIKTDISSIQDDTALNIVNNLDTKEYNYIDPIKKKQMKTIGFIAQDVNDVLPNAVSKVLNIIPDEMRVIDNPQWSQFTDLGGNNKYKLEINNIDFSGNFTGKCKFYVSNDPSGNDEVCKEVIVEDDKKNFIFDESWITVFFYGKEVNDFHTLDKNQIFSLHHSAIQELSRKNDALQTENNELRSRLEALESAVLVLQNK